MTLWNFSVKPITAQNGQVKMSSIVDQFGHQVAVVTSEHHEHMATWLARLMNEALEKDGAMRV